VQRRFFLLATAAYVGFGATAHAEQTTDQVIRYLQRQGFTRFEVSRTWLGRTRIVATGPNSEREIVLSRGSGEILRDHTIQSSDDDDRDRGERDDDNDEDESDDNDNEDDSDDGDDDDGGNDDGGNDDGGDDGDSDGDGEDGGDSDGDDGDGDGNDGGFGGDD